MNDAVQVRPMRDEDADTVSALAAVIWHAHYPGIITVAQIDYMLAQRYNPLLLREELRRDGLWWDVLLVNGVATGYASYYLTDVPDEMKLDKLYLQPALHRRGLGERLARHVMARSRECGCRWLTLAVNRNNHKAIAAYEKWGFQTTATSVRDIGGGFVMDDYLMAIKL
jgi:ribosomal protein S18 acetylase RimI-like enzyme